jgi:thiol-disulfide isomerase/thioredoxin
MNTLVTRLTTRIGVKRLALLGTVLLLTTACVAAATGQRPQAPQGAAAPAPSAPSANQAPELVVSTLDGSTYRLSEHRGAPVVLFFTASWCSSCIPEIATLNKLYEQYQDKGLQVVVVSIDPGDTPADFARFRGIAQGGNYVWGLDTGEKAAVAFDIKALETKIVIGRDGQVVARHVGREPYESAKAAVESAL